MVLAQYPGDRHPLHRSVTDFSACYADQNEQDFRDFVQTVRSGRFQAVEGCDRGRGWPSREVGGCWPQLPPAVEGALLAGTARREDQPRPARARVPAAQPGPGEPSLRLEQPGLGCVIYGVGSLTTSLAPNLPVLILGWSGPEGVGAALILPAIVALAGNYPAAQRPRAYGLVMGAGAIAVAVGPLIGGVAPTSTGKPASRGCGPHRRRSQ